MWAWEDSGEAQLNGEMEQMRVYFFFLLTSLALSGRWHLRLGGIDVDVGGLGRNRN